jgi:two-component system sensor histidine kinase HydH
LTLRRTLLLAFLLLGLLPSAALSWLSFTRTRAAMTAQIRQNLSVQARGIQSDIDQMLFERFENAMVWSRSELMQDLRLGDVDKRVTSYLVGLQSGYGDVYQGMECRSETGQVVASSVASRIGTRSLPDDPRGVSVDARLGGGGARLALPAGATLDDRLPLVIDTEIPSLYALPGTAASHLRLEFNAQQISRLLDAAAVGGRVIVVLDAQGRWVAGSRSLRGRALPDEGQRRLGLALARTPGDATLRGSPWLAAAALTGRGPSVATPRFLGSGWTTLVLEPVDEALAPVSQMALIFAGLLGAVFLATVLAASWIAGAISRPIVTLTDTTRHYQRGPLAPDAARVGSRILELDVLAQAYEDMIRALDQSRQELIRTSKMALLGELAAVLAHEVRTPLGILRSSAQILKRNPGLGAEGQELMRFIESETERLNRLVSTMLDTARPRSPELLDCDLHALLQRCAQMHDLRHGEDGERRPVRLDLAAAHAAVHADGEQLMQVFFNLLNNAAEAAGPTGRVELATHETPGFLCVVCADDGPGVPPELAQRMFDPFVSGRSGGFGLGLAVVRQVVAAHRGEIEVGTSRWGGAAFTVKFRRDGATGPKGIE